MKSVCILLVLVASSLSAPTVQPPSGTLTATCAVDVNSALAEGINDRVTGTVTFTQIDGGDTTIKISLDGFDTTDEHTMHGFHVHASGDLTQGCNSMGGHYNPTNVNHSASVHRRSPPKWFRAIKSINPTRHVGDLGNVMEDDAGRVETTITDDQVSLSGSYSVLNRGIVIHQKADDLGLGGDAGSLASGNAGPRIACCVITSDPYPDPTVETNVDPTGETNPDPTTETDPDPTADTDPDPTPEDY